MIDIRPFALAAVAASLVLGCAGTVTAVPESEARSPSPGYTAAMRTANDQLAQDQRTCAGAPRARWGECYKAADAAWQKAAAKAEVRRASPDASDTMLNLAAARLAARATADTA